MRKNKPHQDMLADLRERLGSANDITQYNAFLEAQDLPVEQLLLLVSTQSRRLHKRWRLETWGVLGCMSMLLIIVSKLGSGVEDANYRWVFIAFIGWVVSMLICTIGLFRYPEDVRPRRRLSRLVQSQQDTRFVGPALLLYHDTDADTRSNARETLLRLMPQLRLEDTRQWDTTQRASLFDILRTPWNDVELTLCALRTIAEAVDIDLEYEKEERRLLMRLLPITASESTSEKQAWFSKSDPNTSGEYCFDNGNDRAQEVRDAAKQCVGAVLARMEQRQKANTLLRPVGMVTDGEQTLLRPAADNESSTPSGQLLRVTQRQQ